MNQKYVNSALPKPRPASTFALQMLRDQQKRLELAQRMREAWESSGHTQQAVADAVGLKLRSYTKALQKGGISYDKLKKMAEFLDVDFDWLLKGDQEPAETPDLLSEMNGDGPSVPDRLSAIESRLASIEEALRERV